MWHILGWGMLRDGGLRCHQVSCPGRFHGWIVMSPFPMHERSLVAIVDDDQSVRESLPDLVRQFGFAAEAFASAEAFLASEAVSETKCLLLDIGMPGMSGPELQQELTRRRQRIPVVFITARADESLRTRLLAEGAVECLFKPFSDTALLDALNGALGVR
jgi:FixJ family two-component response regulator